MNAKSILVKLIHENGGVVSTKEVVRAGISRTTLGVLEKKGVVERVARGQYILPGDLPDDLYILQRRNDLLIYSHETALFLHGLAERTPLVPSATIPSDAGIASTFPVKMKLYYVKPQLYELGVMKEKTQQGNEVKVYSKERTICDIIRSRHRIDDQTVAAALRNYMSLGGKDLITLSEYASLFHVTKTLRRYMEVLS